MLCNHDIGEYLEKKLDQLQKQWKFKIEPKKRKRENKREP